MSTSPEPQPLTCRLCEARCGVLAHVRDGRLAELVPDPEDPVGRGAPCPLPGQSLATLAHPRRLRRALRRQADGRLVPVDTDTALGELGAALRVLRRRHGPRSVGLYLGPAVARDSRLLARALAMGVALGTPNVFSTAEARPRLRVAEWMLGQATPLLPDVGRAHHVVLLGADAEESDWGPLVAGRTQREALAHARSTKGTKVVLAGPRRGPLGELADSHLPVLPGREGWFLLGMLSAIVRGGWHDQQFVRDYTRGFDRLQAALEPWPVDRCARACGLDPAALSGVALKFSRAAMGVVHAGHGAFDNALGALGAWAWLALHAVTANVLRPGGLYAHGGPLDPDLPLQGARGDDGPTTRVGHHPLVHLQAPATALADEALSPGPDQLRALVVVEGDPLLDLPGTDRVRQALAGLELLIVLARSEGPTSALAHGVLPVTHPWEQDALMLLDAPLLPLDMVAFAPAVVAPPEGVRPAEELLRALFRAAHPGPRGNPWGLRWALAARVLAESDLGPWEQRLLSWGGDLSMDDLARAPHRIERGDTDRSRWRVSLDGGRIDLLPAPLAARLAALEPPRPDAELPLLLRTSAPRTRGDDPLLPPTGPGVFAHPGCGLAEGTRVRVQTRHGALEGVLGHDPGLVPGVVDLPRGGPVHAGTILPADAVDPLSGVALRDGVACSLARA